MKARNAKKAAAAVRRERRRREPALPVVSRASGRPRLALVGPRDGDAVRWLRVRTAQARIDAGYYEREDVQHLVVNALLNELKRG